MRFQIIVTPSIAKEANIDIPYGALYIASSLLKEGHDVRIENCDIERFDYAELSRRIKEYQPDAIGISSVMSTAYKYVKETTLAIKNEFAHIKIIVGGALSSSAEILLRNSGTDIIVNGEGDITINELAEKIAKNDFYDDVSGIVFKKGNEIIHTAKRQPIKDLDILRYPAFELIDVERYFIDTKNFVNRFRHYKNHDKRLFLPQRSKRMLRIMISRGCIGQCNFCYRPTIGLRHFSLSYIFNYIEYLIDKLKINTFSFGDECFSPSKAWNREFLEELKKRRINIMFQIMGMRVDTVDYDILCKFKEMGCWMIEYGIESGSQKMLDIMAKNTKVAQNFEVTRWTRQAGIFTSPNFIFGMPGETTKTIHETIDFLKRLNFGPYQYQYAYPLALPGTTLYDYAKFVGLIPDEEKYLEKLSNADIHSLIDTDSFINFTSQSRQAIKNWPKLLKNELLRYYSKNIVVYLLVKYLRVDYISHSLKSHGVRKMIHDIYTYFIKKYRKDKNVPVISRERSNGPPEWYLRMVRKMFEESDQSINLKKLMREKEIVSAYLPDSIYKEVSI